MLGNLVKHELVNLLNIADPNNLGGSGTGKFTFPYQTIEGVQVLDPWTLVVSNDNNYPFSAGRTPGQPDPNETILISLSQPLDVTVKTYPTVNVGTSRHGAGENRLRDDPAWDVHQPAPDHWPPRHRRRAPRAHPGGLPAGHRLGAPTSSSRTWSRPRTTC